MLTKSLKLIKALIFTKTNILILTKILILQNINFTITLTKTFIGILAHIW